MAISLARTKNAVTVKVIIGTTDGKSKLGSINLGTLDRGYSGTSVEMATTANNIVTLLEPCLTKEVSGILLTETNEVYNNS